MTLVWKLNDAWTEVFREGIKGGVVFGEWHFFFLVFLFFLRRMNHEERKITYMFLLDVCLVRVLFLGF